MTTLTQRPRNAGFVVSEANGNYSRETVTIDSTADWSGDAVDAGTIYAIVSGDAVPYDGADDAGAEVAAGIIWEGVAAGETKDVTAIVRDAEVDLAQLTYEGTEAAAVSALADIGIITR
jgi:hypothetical protein